MQAPSEKIVLGPKRRARTGTPAENYARLKHLLTEMERLRPYSKSRGVVYRFRTWEEHTEFVLTRAARRR